MSTLKTRGGGKADMVDGKKTRRKLTRPKTDRQVNDINQTLKSRSSRAPTRISNRSESIDLHREKGFLNLAALSWGDRK